MQRVHGWAGSQGISPRDVRIVVPVGAVLSLARRAWAEVSPGWMPQIDTIAGWAQQVAWLATPSGHAAAQDAGDFPPMSLHPVADQMHLRAAWARQGWASAWQRRDPRGYDHGLAKVVTMAHAVLQRLQAVAPAARAAWVERALGEVAQRQSGAQMGQPGARESLLQQWAVNWAAHVAAQGLAGDALFDQRPAAVVMVIAGDTVAPGTEAHWALSLLAHWHGLGVPVLRLHAQPQRPGEDVAAPSAPQLFACRDAEDEAQQACAVVLQTVCAQRELGEAGQPVALLALDRSVIRRMRALLEGAGVRLADETGWRLSTTRAASALTRVLKAARPQASTEDWMDWFKSGWLPTDLALPSEGAAVPASLAEATAQLETHCRRHQVLQAWSLVDDRQLPDAARALCLWATQVLQPLQARWTARGGTLADWLQAMADALQRSGAWALWAQDEAGQAAWLAVTGGGLQADAEATKGAAVQEGTVLSAQAWAGLAHKARMDGHRFGRWLSEVLEATVFRPPSPPQADVVITTLARATLRPFAALVMPGAHLGQLGALEPVDPWMGGAWARAMDLSTPAARRAMQWEAWALLMNQPGMVCLQRTGQGSEPLSPSPWLAQWQEGHGVAWQAGEDVRPRLAVEARAQTQPSPAVPAPQLPTRWNATAYDTMRDCPYRYFAAHVLGLRQQDELEEGVDHADHGTWLHEVLRSFHTKRAQWPEGLSDDEALALWLQCAQAVADAHGLSQEATRPYFAPYLADAPKIGQAYLHWLHAHEAEGWQVRWMEQQLTAAGPGQPGAPLTLHGQIDRLDAAATAGASNEAGHLLIDYKTGNLQRLKTKVRTPDEDTQLAFYAVLAPMAGALGTAGGSTGAEAPLNAAYLHLHRDQVTLVSHTDVGDTAERLTQAMAVDWQRLQAGHGLTALGEGPACAHCQHQGLCRKAHWTAPPDDASQGDAP